MAWELGAYIKDYCVNCTLAGIDYIANQKWVYANFFSSYYLYLLSDFIFLSVSFGSLA